MSTSKGRTVCFQLSSQRSCLDSRRFFRNWFSLPAGSGNFEKSIYKKNDKNFPHHRFPTPPPLFPAAWTSAAPQTQLHPKHSCPGSDLETLPLWPHYHHQWLGVSSGLPAPACPVSTQCGKLVSNISEPDLPGPASPSLTGLTGPLTPQPCSISYSSYSTAQPSCSARHPHTDLQ